jgi:hypothetical protein
MKTTLIIISTLLISFLVQSQESLAISAGEASGSGGTSSYTLGQVFYTTTNTSTGSVGQGVQQSFELFTLSNPQLTTVNLEAVIYPNPSSDYVVLNITDTALTDLSYVLVDIRGQVISNQKISSLDTQISLHGLSIGTYVLKVSKKNSELKMFKIIKK